MKLAPHIYQYVGSDKMGVPRVYGHGMNPDVAESECVQMVREYVQHRPDTGPVSAWTVKLQVKP